MTPGFRSMNPIANVTVAILPGGIWMEDCWPKPNCKLKSE